MSAADNAPKDQQAGRPGYVAGQSGHRPDEPRSVRPARSARARMLAGAVARTDLTHVLLERLGRPRHHRGHRTPPRRAAFHRLAVSHMAHTAATQLRNGRVDREVVDVQHRCFPRGATPGVDHLEQRGVSKAANCPLRREQLARSPSRRRRRKTPAARPGQRSTLRPFVGSCMRGAVVFANHLRRNRTGSLLTTRRPSHSADRKHSRGTTQASPLNTAPDRDRPYAITRAVQRPMPLQSATRRIDHAHPPPLRKPPRQHRPPTQISTTGETDSGVHQHQPARIGHKLHPCNLN